MVNFMVYAAVIVILFWAYKAEEVPSCEDLKEKCVFKQTTCDCSGCDLTKWLTYGHLRLLHDCNFKTVNLSRINISCMPKFPPLSIEALDLSRNRFLRFHPESFEGLQDLRVLDLSHNFLKIRFIVLSKLEKLRELYLQHNKIPSLGNLFNESAPNLETINLSDNPLKESALGSLSGLKNLKYLDLSYTKIERLPKELFDNLNQLTYLNLAGNTLKTIEAALPTKQHFSLKTLILDDNPIKVLGNDENDFPNLVALEVLSISNLTDLEVVVNSPFEKLQNLKSLYLKQERSESKIGCSAFVNETQLVLPRLEELHLRNKSLRGLDIRLNLISDFRVCDETEYFLENKITLASFGAGTLLLLSCGVTVVLYYVVTRKVRQNKLMQRHIQADEEKAFRKCSSWESPKSMYGMKEQIIKI